MVIGSRGHSGKAIATVTIAPAPLAPVMDREFGIFYITPNGEEAHALWDENRPEILTVMKGSFLLPLYSGDIYSNCLSGDLSVVYGADKLFSDKTGYRTVLVYVNGDGTIDVN